MSGERQTGHRLGASVTAELLAGARALSLADRHHFELNLSDLLDKSTQYKKNWLLNVIAARQRFERQQANFEGIQTLSVYSQFQADQVDGYRTTRIVFSLNLISRCPIPWARLSPQSTGTKDAISSAKDALCNHSRGSSPSLAFSTATMCYIPSVTQNLQMSLSKLLPSDRSISVKFSTMESPWCGLLCRDT